MSSNTALAAAAALAAGALAPAATAEPAPAVPVAPAATAPAPVAPAAAAPAPAPALDAVALRAEGASAERARIAGILGSDEAKSRPKAANNLAFKTAMSVDEAKAFLADSAEESASGSGLGARMASQPNPPKPGAPTGTAPAAPAIDAAAIYDRLNAPALPARAA